MDTKHRIRRSPDQWRTIFAQFERSGLSAPAFCRQHKISYGSFQRWRHRIDSVPSEPAQVAADWLPIHVTEAVTTQHASDMERSTPDWDIELALPGGVVLRMKAA